MLSFSSFLVFVVLLFVFKSSINRVLGVIDKSITHVSIETEVLYGERRKVLKKHLMDGSVVTEVEILELLENKK